ncbi:MAG: alanine dehydrogenase [Deinococcus sp.]|nr:alanine dehydrogenase [Deinococcus sp.]
MEISIPRECRGLEKRVAVTPRGCAGLLAAGHRVFVEAGAGEGAGYSDTEYEAAGARLVWSREEAFGRGDLVVKVSHPTPEEVALLPAGGAVAGFLHLAAAPKEQLETLARRHITALAFEQLQIGDERPILTAMSELAGRLCPQIAGRWLETPSGGRGVLLSGVPGVAAAEVVILGAGTVGGNAARAFAALGAQVTLLDVDTRRLRAAEASLPGRVALVHADEVTIARSVAYADVLVGAVLVPGERAPVLVSTETVQRMRPDAVILDLSIDQGGCVETSRPTTLEDPVFRAHGVLHYCVPNTPALVARTASHALSHAVVPLLAAVPGELATALRAGHPLSSAVALYQGTPVRASLAQVLGVEAAPLEQLLGGRL